MEALVAAGGSPDPVAAAAALIAEFGSFPATLAGNAARQLKATGHDIAAVRAVRGFATAMRYALNVQLAQRPVLENWDRLIDYLRVDMGYDTIERFRVLHLNTQYMLIRDEVMSEGTIDRSSVHIREVLHRAMDLGSASIILVHNHPSGEVSASRSDIDITRAIIEAARRLGIAVHDHLIIGADRHRSLKSEGLI